MKLFHKNTTFETVKSKVIISLFETVKLSVSISPRNLYNSLKSKKEMISIAGNNDAASKCMRMNIDVIPF